MKNVIHASLIGLMLIIFLSAASVSAYATQRGSIRGTIYQDLDENGVCGGNDTRISNFGLNFTSADGSENVRLVSGANGTYGLVGAGLGKWTVTAVPPTSSWKVTSTNPRIATITSAAPVITNIDFCVQGTGSIATTQPVVNPPSTASRLIIGVAPSASVKNEPPSSDLEANFEISQELLNIKVEGPSYEELEQVMAETPVDEEVVEVPNWLSYVNSFRAAGNLPLLTESPSFTQGSNNHARFMVLNDLCCAHSENPANPLFTLPGNSSGVNGNIFASSWTGGRMEHAVNFWMSAPFHLLGIIDPALQEVGYGEFRQDIGVFRYAAVLDVRSNEIANFPVSNDIYPLYFPADGAETFIVRRSLPEWPNPLATPACAGYKIPTGPALILMLGHGDQTPRVSSQKVFENGRLVESCAFSEISYINPDPYAQQTGRSILGGRDAVVVTPRFPLLGGATYRVELTVNGEAYAWEFSVGDR